MIKRFKYVVDHVMGMVPPEYQNHPAVTFFRVLARDMVKDIALVPDERLAAMALEAGNAFVFIAEGDLDDLLARQVEENERIP